MVVPATDAPRVTAFASIDRVLADAVDGGVAAGLVGAVGRGDAELYEAGYGVRVAGSPAPMEADTIVWLASMTKLVTTIAAMQLVETGALALDVPIAGLLPELAGPDVLAGFAADGSPILRPARGLITLRQLLTHSSGIGYELMHPDLLRARGPGGTPAATSLASLRGPLATDPGTGWTYGYGIDWAGIAIERRSGLTLDRYMAEHIFAPLAMHDTGFVVPETARSRVAGVQLRQSDGTLVTIPSPAGAPEDWEFHSGGAGLFGTARDYLRLLRMILRGGELDGVRILRADTVAAMTENQIGDRTGGRLDTSNPAITLPYDPLPGQVAGWSLLGARNAAAVPGARHAGSASWAGIAGTLFWVDPDADLCGVLIAQLLPFADPALRAVQLAFEHAAYADAAPTRD